MPNSRVSTLKFQLLKTAPKKTTVALLREMFPGFSREITATARELTVFANKIADQRELATLESLSSWRTMDMWAYVENRITELRRNL